MENLVENLKLPTYTKDELISAHQDWLRNYKDVMSFTDYRKHIANLC